ncbi:MAG: metal ABC transporter permease [Acidobacteria bacterium]|jgi:manganese/zinc/iron transport system permease protein|nr:metal ABC transporter permease [Acidobacteriota bacterium]
MSPELQILLTAVVTAVAAALPGTYLVLRRTALVSDAISHAILPGIVIAFFLTRDLNSPLLLIAAASTGVLTVFLIETLLRSHLVPEDAAIGLVFPALFSVGVILISRFAGDIHLDTDSVLLGEIAWVPFDQMIVGGMELGPRALWTMGGILALNLVAIGLAWKELKLATVDPELAALLGFSPVALHYSLMALVSITAVGAFDAVGSILVVALMIAPPATAYLLVDRFCPMLCVGAAVAAVCAGLGCAVAFALDVSIAGSMASICGTLFAAALLLAPRRGLVAQARRRSSQKLDLGVRMLLVHLLHHQSTASEAEECRVPSLHRHLQWSESRIRQVVREAEARELVTRAGEILHATAEGKTLAEVAVIGEPAVERKTSHQ